MTIAAVNTDIDKMLEEVKDGWASPAKCHVLAELIEKTKPNVCVEIGVFAGRSLFAQAIALKAFGDGRIFGIDPWRKEPTLEGGIGDLNAAWWSSLDLDKLHNDFMANLWRLNLQDQIIVLRNTSQQVAPCFPKLHIDILHIDGNHSEEISCRDVRLWLPKVPPARYVLVDDCDWPSVAAAIKLVEKKCILTKQVDQCLVFCKT